MINDISTKRYLLLALIFLMMANLAVATSCKDDIPEPVKINTEITLPHFSERAQQVLMKKQLRILDIGNSYTQDATELLKYIAKASGADLSNICIYAAIRSSASFQSWYNVYNDKDDRKYNVFNVLGNLGANVNVGIAKAGDGSLFRETLNNQEWDMIVIHQYSLYAPYYQYWENDDGDRGYLNQLINLIRQAQPNAVIGMYVVHSYWDDFDANMEHSSFERWRLIAESVKNILASNENIEFVIPYGTAVENMRQTSFNNEFDITRDGTHLALGLGRYTAACSYYQSILAPRTGIPVLGNSYRYNVEAQSKYPVVAVNDENAWEAQKAAILATKNPFDCINPQDYRGVTYKMGKRIIYADVVRVGSTITTCQLPEEDGYDVTGWFVDKECTTLYNPLNVITQDIILYAKKTERKPMGINEHYEYDYNTQWHSVSGIENNRRRSRGEVLVGNGIKVFNGK